MVRALAVLLIAAATAMLGILPGGAGSGEGRAGSGLGASVSARAQAVVGTRDGARPVGVPGGVHVVAEGDTLWGVALALAPNDDPRATVDRILTLNDKARSGLQVGEVLALPTLE